MAITSRLYTVCLPTHYFQIILFTLLCFLNKLIVVVVVVRADTLFDCYFVFLWLFLFFSFFLVHVQMKRFENTHVRANTHAERRSIYHLIMTVVLSSATVRTISGRQSFVRSAQSFHH